MWMHFIYFSFLIVMVGTFINVLNKRGNIGYLGLVPDLTRNAFSFSPLSMMLAVSLSYIAFFMLRYVPSVPSFWRVFSHKWMMNFIKSLFCMFWDDHMVFVLQFLNVMYHIDWFVDTEEFLYPWDKSHLIIMYDPFGVLLTLVYYYLVENFCIYVHLWHWPVIFLVCMYVIFLSGFDIRVMVAL